MRLFDRTAVHICVVPTLSRRSFVKDPQLGSRLERARPKTNKWVRVPVSREISPWIKEFLDSSKPRHRSSCNDVLDALATRIQESTGMVVRLNPSRFRHAAFVDWYHQYHLTASEVQDLAGTTWRTLQTYASRPKIEVVHKLPEEGF